MSPLRFSLALLLGGGSSVGWAVSTDSPFLLPAGSGAQAPSLSVSGIEFCGVVERGGKPVFALYETSTGKGRWLSAQEGKDGWVVRSYDAARQELMLEVQGQVLTLSLRRARLDGGSVAVNSPPPSALPPGVSAPTIAPTAEDEATRLRAVADEIKRRRALRAAQAMTHGGPPPPPPVGNGP